VAISEGEVPSPSTPSIPDGHLSCLSTSVSAPVDRLPGTGRRF
jgi:hypothetical protein